MNSWLFVSLNNENVKEKECSMEELISDISENIIHQEKIDQNEENDTKEKKEIVVNITDTKKENKNIENFKNKLLYQTKIFSIYTSNVEHILYEQIINVGLCYDYLSFENKICIIGIFAVFCTSLM
jgi:hypothetical protein